jgi:DNA mismatch repair protein MutS2
MNRHTIRVLEFERIRSELCESCLTSDASETLHKERVRVDSAEIAKLISQAQAVRRCLESKSEFPAAGFPSIRPSLRRLEKEGAVLEAAELAEIGLFARSAERLRAFLESAAAPEDGTIIGELTAAFPDVREVDKRVARVVDDDGSIREREIPELKRIRDQIVRAGQELAREAQSLLGRDELRRYWNGTVPTQREGRTVLPLKADHRGKVRGIVHEASGTGATVFIEPDSLVERNNAVVEAENRYRVELLRILRELSRFCATRRDDLVACVDSVVAVDVILARARFAIRHECVAAAPADDRLVLRSARHPLLGSGAVPISLEFPPGKRVIVITGPNTGGKTVSLKTVGLLAMMNQFGMEIPVAPGTELPVFSGIFADIGDEQSIEQSLSTFSGHMLNISRILNGSDEHSLVLLDELGSGTDPEEGGALAMAILDELLERGPHTVVTTHHGALKHYGFTQPAAANASVEFDTRSLRPTYRIVPGVPGSSHAIEVAAHMGLLRKVTNAARAYLAGDEYDTGRIIRALTDTEQQLHRERERIRDSERDLEASRAKLDNEVRELGARERELREGRLRDLEKWSAQARRTLENLVREIREGELTREKTQRVKQFIAETDAALGAERESLRHPSPHSQPPESGRATGAPLEVGREVRVRSSGQRGVVTRKGKGRSWQVQVGAVRMTMEEDDLEAVEAAADAKPIISVSHVSARPDLELDLRGMRLEDALAAVERQLDQAVLAGLTRFGIIHGMGEGVLQGGVQKLLRASPHVRSFEFAPPEDGGFGKTIVMLS